MKTAKREPYVKLDDDTRAKIGNQRKLKYIIMVAARHFSPMATYIIIQRKLKGQKFPAVWCVCGVCTEQTVLV